MSRMCNTFATSVKLILLFQQFFVKNKLFISISLIQSFKGRQKGQSSKFQHEKGQHQHQWTSSFLPHSRHILQNKVVGAVVALHSIMASSTGTLRENQEKSICCISFTNLRERGGRKFKKSASQLARFVVVCAIVGTGYKYFPYTREQRREKAISVVQKS